MFDQGMQSFDFDNSINGSNNVIENDVDVNMMYNGGQMMQGNQMVQGGMMSNPVNEGVQERIVQRTIVHDVPQVSPFM